MWKKTTHPFLEKLIKKLSLYSYTIVVAPVDSVTVIVAFPPEDGEPVAVMPATAVPVPVVFHPALLDGKGIKRQSP